MLPDSQCLRSSVRWHIGFMPHAYSFLSTSSDHLESCDEKDSEVQIDPTNTALSSISRICQGWQREGFEVPGKESTGIKPAFQDTLVLDKIQCGFSQTNPSLCRCNKGESVLSYFRKPISTKREQIISLGVEEN